MKRKGLVKSTLLALVVCFVGSIFYFTIAAFDENKSIKSSSDEFKNNSSFYSYSKKYSSNFYIVDNKSIIPDSPSFTIIDDEIYPGYNGDILCSLWNELANKVESTVFTYYFGGHAALVCNGEKVFQTFGYSEKSMNHADYGDNDWLMNHTVRFNYVGVKVKTEQSNKDYVVSKASTLQNKPYNYTFILNRKNSFYCTDLVEYLYKTYGNIALNDDEMVVTVQDIIVSKNTEMFLYKERNPLAYNDRPDGQKGEYNVYFLDDGNDYKYYLSKEE